MLAHADLDPLEISKLMPHMALAEVRSYGPRLRVRLVGTNIVNIYSASFIGQYLDEIDFGDAIQPSLSHPAPRRPIPEVVLGVDCARRDPTPGVHAVQ